jgi:hypothetical protein
VARGLGTRGRFALAYLALGAVVGIGVGSFLVLLQREGPQPPPPWSSWKPSAITRELRVLEIARHVGASYHLASGDQLAAVEVGGPTRDQKVRAIVVPTKPEPKTLADFQPYDESKSTVFTLCGSGANCTLPAGGASAASDTVLRREALELALYTLEYARPVDNVLVFVPPAPGEKKVKSTLFFHRDDLSGNLHKPLRKTLPQRRPPLPGEIATREQQTVEALTGTSLYSYIGIVTAKGFGKLLVIQPSA